MLETGVLDALDAASADRYALAFRPSWAPLLHEPQPAAARSHSLGHDAAAHKVSVEREHHEPLSLAAKRTRRRGSLLAGASVLSFIGLVYWGVSSSTPAAPAHMVQPAKAPSAQPQLAAPTAPAPAPASEETAVAAAEPTAPPFPAPTGDLSALAARPEAPTEATATAAEAPPDQAQVAAEQTGPTTSERPETPTGPASTEQTAHAEAAPAAAVSEPVASAEPVAPSAPSPAPPAVPAEPVAALRQPPAPAAQPAASAVVASAAPAQPAAPAATKQPSAPLAAAPAQPTPIASAQAARAQNPESAPQPKRLPLLSVRALPEGARLFLDGQRLPNPFDMRLPEGGKHKLEARFEGYETSTQTVRIESDAKLTITLRRVGAAVDPQLQVRPLNQQQQHTRGAGFVTSNPY